MTRKSAGFVDREFELKSLEGICRKPGPGFVVVYGRRRVGKTELIKEFSKGKELIYFLADKRGTESNVQRLASLAAWHFNDTEPAAKGIEDVFEYIKKRAGKSKRVVVAIDEFPNLVEKDSSIPSVFQLIVDEIMPGTRILLLISGSSMSMMERLLGGKSPLYGRRTAHYRLEPLKIWDAWKFYPKYGIEDAIKAYSVTGGIPYYCSLFSQEKSVPENIRDVVLSKDGRLYEEAEFLLKEELREPSAYEGILEAMSTGLAAPTNIADYAGMNAKDASFYLRTLVNLRVVRKEVSLEDKRKKKGLYFIEDNFFRFWFRYAKPNMSRLEAGDTPVVMASVGKGMEEYVSRHVFEQVCKDFLSRKAPFSPQEIGRWWERGREIDIVAFDRETRQILFAECKWKDGVDAGRVLEELKEKSAHVKWKQGKRQEHFAVFAKSFSKKAEGALLFDLKDLERAFRD